MQTVERLIHMRKGPPWGFRLQDAFNGNIAVSEVRRQSPADLAGLRDNDIIVAINNYSTMRLNKSNILDVISHSNNELDLTIQRQEQRKPQVMTFFLDSSAVRGHMVQQEMASRNLDISWQKKPTPPLLLPNPSSIKSADPNTTPVSLNRLRREFDVPKARLPAAKRPIANSTFHSKTSMPYPSLEERIQLARQVAQSFEAPVNQGSRGAKMFELRQLQLEKYVTEGPEPTSDNLKETSIQQPERMSFTTPPPPPPPPPQASLSAQSHSKSISAQFPASPSNPALTLKQQRSLQEYVEKMRSFPKSTLTKISPQNCFDIAAALHSSKSRGGTMFAKQREQSQKWEANNTIAATPMLDPKQTVQPHLLSNLKHLNHDQVYSAEQKSTSPLLSQRQNQGFLSNRAGISKIPLISQLPSMAQNLPFVQSSSVVANVSERESDLTSSSSSRPRWRPVKFNIPQRAS